MYGPLKISLVCLVALSACAPTVERVQEELDPIIDRAIAEKQALNDLEVRRWRKYLELTCHTTNNLSFGAVDRNLNEEWKERFEKIRTACKEMGIGV